MWLHVVGLTGINQWMKMSTGPSQRISNEKKIRNCTTKRMENPNELTRRWTRKVRIVSGNQKLKQSGKIGHMLVKFPLLQVL
jgi:hypothetical protein